MIMIIMMMTMMVILITTMMMVVVIVMMIMVINDDGRIVSRQVRAMVRDVNNFYPRKRDLGNGPIEVVLGDVLDKVSDLHTSVPLCPEIYGPFVYITIILKQCSYWDRVV